MGMREKQMQEANSYYCMMNEKRQKDFIEVMALLIKDPGFEKEFDAYEASCGGAIVFDDVLALARRHKMQVA